MALPLSPPPAGTGGGAASARAWVGVPGAFSPDECDRLQDAFGDDEADDGGLVAGRFDASVRQSRLSWLPTDGSFDWVDQRLARVAASANAERFHFALDGFEEQVQLAAYGPGHHYDWHVDRGSGSVAGRRKLTVSVQLTRSDAYVDGDLEINGRGHAQSAPREQGTAIVFPSYVLHRVAPVVSGLRKSLVVWLHGPDYV